MKKRRMQFETWIIDFFIFFFSTGNYSSEWWLSMSRWRTDIHFNIGGNPSWLKRIWCICFAGTNFWTITTSANNYRLRKCKWNKCDWSGEVNTLLLSILVEHFLWILIILWMCIAQWNISKEEINARRNNFSRLGRVLKVLKSEWRKLSSEV